MSDFLTWIAACMLAVAGFFTSQCYFQEHTQVSKTRASRGDSRNLSAEDNSSPRLQRRGNSFRRPVRFAASARELTRQEEAGTESSAEMMSMRRALGLAIQSEAMSLKRCVANSDSLFVDAVIRFQVHASKLELQAHVPQLLEVPNEAMATCLLDSLATQYSAETTAERPFLDGYSGDLDIRATINAPDGA